MERGIPVCPLWVHRFAVLTAGATLVLIFVGALVTSTGSGLAVPDWPLSFGQVFPRMVGGVLFEHGHRLVAAFVGLLTVTLMVLLTQWEPRAWVRWLARGASRLCRKGKSPMLLRECRISLCRK